ncbi:hypothetical protein [Lutispora saccharofermentans]|uniref:Uncharacterized protein n=1 Tax=Lutispora saccharofermentans TaxID=3024236 RepID=A0ABT1NHE7_9FIRM|nr:hypothetical protein [Lutispora saccharofermentans]MCQ1530680.1 hypothetical protein [Lutispora saccharofermentans]
MESKRIGKTDESGKKLIIKMLGSQKTHGFDIDSIYYLDGKWRIIELLKCDTVEPYKSHPFRYPKNWQKFASLFEITNALKGELWLVNYSTVPEWENEVRLLIVEDMYYDKIKEYLKKPKVYGAPEYLEYLKIKKDSLMTYDEFSDFFREVNNKATALWLDKIK